MLLEMMAKKYDEDNIAELEPAYHAEYHADGEVTVDMNGNFVSVLLFPKEPSEKKGREDEKKEEKGDAKKNDNPLPPGYRKTLCPYYKVARSGKKPRARGLCDTLKYMHVFNADIDSKYLEKIKSGHTDDIPQDKLEKALKDAQGYDRFQFVRNGFFCVDSKDSTPGAPVFNRIVSLKSSFVLPKKEG